MEDKLNLVEILKNTLPGTKLWSPLYGDCEFVRIKDNESNYPICCKVKQKDGFFGYTDFSTKGTKGEYDSRYENCECMLFPSKKNRDWSTFKVSKPYKHFKPYQKVLIQVWNGNKPIWIADLYSHYDKDVHEHVLVGSSLKYYDDNIIPYEGNEDKLGKPIE